MAFQTTHAPDYVGLSVLLTIWILVRVFLGLPFSA